MPGAWQAAVITVEEYRKTQWADEELRLIMNRLEECSGDPKLHLNADYSYAERYVAEGC